MSLVELTHEERIATITLADPRHRNVISPQWGREFRAAAEQLAGGLPPRVVVLGARGGAFCMGGDLRAFASARDPATCSMSSPRICIRGCWPSIGWTLQQSRRSKALRSGQR